MAAAEAFADASPDEQFIALTCICNLVARARETLAGGRARLVGSDSEGNQRARPSLKRPLPAKAA